MRKLYAAVVTVAAAVALTVTGGSSAQAGDTVTNFVAPASLITGNGPNFADDMTGCGASHRHTNTSSTLP